MEGLPKLLDIFKLKEEDICQPISDGHIQEISLSNCKKWRSLPAYLELPPSVVDDINRSTIAIEEGEKRSMFLSNWKGQKASDATYKSLISAMLKIRCKEDAEFVMKLLGDSLQNDTSESKSCS